MLRVRALTSVQGALSRPALAMAVGDAVVPLANAHAPALASAPALLSPPQSILPSEKDLEGLRVSFGSIGSSGVVKLPSTPVGHDAQ
jgi:hypothetical protein